MTTHNQLEIGQIVYFIMNDGYNYQKRIHFGVVDDMFSGDVSVKLYTQKESRLINGIPYNEFKTPTQLQKLPKGWTYNTELFKIGWEKVPDDILNKCYINNPDDVLKMIKDGWLIPNEEKDWSHIEAVVDKNGWQLIRKSSSEYHPSSILCYYYDLYITYEDAQKCIDKYEAELKRQSELTDVEWSLELIEKNVDRYLTFNYPDEEVRESKKKLIMEWFASMKNVEDIETRVLANSIEWKYWKNKKWNTVNQNIL